MEKIEVYCNCGMEQCAVELSFEKWYDKFVIVVQPENLDIYVSKNQLAQLIIDLQELIKEPENETNF